MENLPVIKRVFHLSKHTGRFTSFLKANNDIKANTYFQEHPDVSVHKHEKHQPPDQSRHASHHGPPALRHWHQKHNADRCQLDNQYYFLKPARLNDWLIHNDKGRNHLLHKWIHKIHRMFVLSRLLPYRPPNIRKRVQEYRNSPQNPLLQNC